MAGFLTTRVINYSFTEKYKNSEKKKAYHGRDRQGLHTAI